MIDTIIDNYRSDLIKSMQFIDDYLRKNNSEEELVSIIKTMNSCNCCNRHQINKPSSLEEYVIINTQLKIKIISVNVIVDKLLGIVVEQNLELNNIGLLANFKYSYKIININKIQNDKL